MSASITSALPTSAAPSQTSAPQSSGPQSSPLLFFVALGFGVVFTNLWIIVGVKYCFRYNARNRLRQDENGDPIDLATIPRQHRRRREKKLMTIDEVNERFPITKYKTWVSRRADEGLSTAGGVAGPQSRPTSVKDAPGVIEPVSNRVGDNTGPLPAASSTPNNDTSAVKHTENHDTAKAVTEFYHPPTEIETQLQETKTIASTLPERTDEEIDDDDQIQMAVPTEMLANPGDSCAICIDTLEDDDDVRGLTCGHAFHASCVDPWLISRRACCPLCKADYYVPKPRPEGDQAQDGERPSRRPTGQRPNSAPQVSGFALFGSRFRPRVSDRHRHNRPAHNLHLPRIAFGRRQSPRSDLEPRSSPTTLPTEPEAVAQPGWTSRLRPSMPTFGRSRRNEPAHATSTDMATPAQLEAGIR